MKIQLSLFPTNYCEVCHSEVEGDYAVCSVKCQIKLNEKHESNRRDKRKMERDTLHNSNINLHSNNY